MDTLILHIILALAWATAGWQASTIVHRARHRREAKENTSRAIAAALDQVGRQLLGAPIQPIFVEDVDPADIRLGDQIVWHSEDDSEHAVYTAAHHGDAGTKASGRWTRVNPPGGADA